MLLSGNSFFFDNALYFWFFWYSNLSLSLASSSSASLASSRRRSRCSGQPDGHPRPGVDPSRSVPVHAHVRVTPGRPRPAASAAESLRRLLRTLLQDRETQSPYSPEICSSLAGPWRSRNPPLVSAALPLDGIGGVGFPGVSA